MQTKPKQPTSRDLYRLNALSASQQLRAPMGFWVNLCTRTVTASHVRHVLERRA
jgi:hypothetical protein